MSQSSNKLVEAYVLIVIALLCMIGFSYRSHGSSSTPVNAEAATGATTSVDVAKPVGAATFIQADH